MKRALPWVIVAIVAVLVVRELFPKRIEVVTPPRITTIRDTVRRLDTAWVTRLVRQTDTLYRERVTVTLPETVYVAPRLMGLTALAVAPKVGDSTLAQGFSVAPADSGGIVRMGWQVQWWTPGPLRALVVTPEGVRAAWGEPPPKGCGFWCALKHYSVGAAGGFAACKL